MAAVQPPGGTSLRGIWGLEFTAQGLWGHSKGFECFFRFSGLIVASLREGPKILGFPGFKSNPAPESFS